MSYRYPNVLKGIRNSTVVLANAIQSFNGLNKTDFIIHEILGRSLNIMDPSQSEIDSLVSGNNLKDTLSTIISIRAQLGWTTHGHTGVDGNFSFFIVFFFYQKINFEKKVASPKYYL